MADNVRLGKEEEEALHCKGNNNDDNSYRGGGGEGEMEGEVDKEGEGGGEGEEIYLAVLDIVIRIIHSNNTYFTSIPLLV
jgi:hypothetical protein